MRKKKLEKSQSELERESKEFLEKNRKELDDYYIKCCKEHDLPYESPFSSEEGFEILAFMKKKEEEGLLKLFPHFYRLSEWEQLNAKLIIKFSLPRNLSLKDGSAIQKAISGVLKKKGGLSKEVDPALYKFKK